jgi:Flp pilus assembly protein TadD
MFNWLKVRLGSGTPQSLSLMAAIAADEHRIEDGLRCAEAAISENPQDVAAHYAAGRLWDLAGRPDRSEACYRQVIQLDPDHARAHNNLGRVLSLKGDLVGAVSCYRNALRLDPAQPEANSNYATLTGDEAAREAAIQGYLRRTQADPRDTGAFTSLANILSGSGRYEEALALLDQVLSIDSEHAEAHYARAVLRLTLGDYVPGWAEFEWRWRLGNHYSDPALRFPVALWDGRRIEGGVILLHGDLAFGDSLQFVRYARLVAERCGSVVFECPPELKSLFERVEGIARVVVPGDVLPSFDAHAAITSLPRIFGTTLQSVPWYGPYVTSDRELAEHWRGLVDTEAAGRYKVGLVWTGNHKAANNRDRSVSLDILAPLQEIQGAALYSLQKGGAGAPGPAGALRVVDHTSRLGDFGDTAAFISCLDLVITIDTSVAHLAGAMGKPVWVLLNRTADWRYHLERSDNPWYPSMRLYRQAHEGQWAGVIDQVARDLREAVARRGPAQGE